MRLSDYLNTLSWSQTDLAKEAGISVSTVRRAMKEQRISRPNARAICDALTRGLKRPIAPSDVNELHITDLNRPSRKKPEGQPV